MATMTVRELFDFVTDPTLADDKVDEYLDKVGSRRFPLVLVSS